MLPSVDDANVIGSPKSSAKADMISPEEKDWSLLFHMSHSSRHMTANDSMAAEDSHAREVMPLSQRQQRLGTANGMAAANPAGPSESYAGRPSASREASAYPLWSCDEGTVMGTESHGDGTALSETASPAKIATFWACFCA